MLIPQATEEVSSFMEPPQENQQTRENSTCNFLYDLDQIMDDIRSTLHPLQYEMYRKILKKYIQSKIPKTVLDFELNRLLGPRFLPLHNFLIEAFIHNAHNQDYDPNSTYELMKFTNKKQDEKEFLGQAEEQIVLESDENSLENSESNNNSNIKIDNQKLVDNISASGKKKGIQKRVIPPPLQLKNISAASMQSPMSPVNEQSQSGTQQKKNKISKFAPQIQDFKSFDQAPGVSKHPEDVKRANKNYQHNSLVQSQKVKIEEQQNLSQTPTTIRLPQHKRSQDSLQTMQMQLNLSNKASKTLENKHLDAESNKVYKKDSQEVGSDEKDSESSLIVQEQQNQQTKRIKLAHQGSYHQIFDIQKVKSSLNQTPSNNAPIQDNTISIHQESSRESPNKINIKQIQQSPIQQQVVSTNQDQISDKIQTQVLPCTEKIVLLNNQIQLSNQIGVQEKLTDSQTDKHQKTQEQIPQKSKNQQNSRATKSNLSKRKRNQDSEAQQETLKQLYSQEAKQQAAQKLLNDQEQEQDKQKLSEDAIKANLDLIESKKQMMQKHKTQQQSNNDLNEINKNVNAPFSNIGQEILPNYSFNQAIDNHQQEHQNQQQLNQNLVQPTEQYFPDSQHQFDQQQNQINYEQQQYQNQQQISIQQSQDNQRLGQSTGQQPQMFKVFEGCGLAQDYEKKFKEILLKYLKMKHFHKKQYYESQKLNPQYVESSKNLKKQAVVYNQDVIQHIMTEITSQNGLTMKDPEGISEFVLSELSEFMEKLFGQIKMYYEDEIKIKWEEFQPYRSDMTDQQKEEQDWDNFILSLREQSIRFFLIDKPDFLGSKKFTWFYREKLF
eukprot:403366858